MSMISKGLTSGTLVTTKGLGLIVVSAFLKITAIRFIEYISQVITTRDSI